MAAALGGCSRHGADEDACPAGGRKGPSGYCVPRYLSLKAGEVFGRKGPGMTYDKVWTYHVRGLPVQVIAETREWRKICDPDGQTTWVHISMLDGRRAVVAREDAPLRRKPSDSAGATAELRGKAMAQLDRCEEGWCKVKVGGASGWTRADALWGVAETAQCR